MHSTSPRIVPHSMATRSAAWLTLLSFIIGSCGGQSSGAPKAAAPIADVSVATGAGSGSAGVLATGDIPDGLDMRLSNGKQGADAFDHSKLAPATKLSDDEAEKLLARMKAIATDGADKKDFALREKSQPPPRTGKTVKGEFPPPLSSLLPPTTNEAGKDLSVLRFAPQGKVPLAPQLSVTFSQPMVAVTSQSDAAANVPVTLSPTPPGHWRWIGTRTLLFDADIRFPQATTYQVAIPAGTKSATGNTLPKATTFSFETPTPRMLGSYPNGGPVKRDAKMFVWFDQKIDQAAVLATIKVVSGNKTFPLHLLDATEIAKDKTIKDLIGGAKSNEQDGRWLAFGSDQEFPSDSQVAISVGPGTPSAEGPNKTADTQYFSFQTYAPLKIIQAQCGWRKQCPPGTPFGIQFNNPLDQEKFDASQLTVTPAIPGVKIEASGGSISVYGMTKANTTYQVVVSGGLLDSFGQTLGKDANLSFHVTSATPSFSGPSGMIVVDPAAKTPSLDYFTVNYPNLKVQLYKVQVSDLPQYYLAMRTLWNNDKPPTIPGKRVFDGLVKTTAGKDDLVETHVDLTKALGEGNVGQVLAIVEPSPWKEKYQPPRMYSWVQVTKLAVDASVDGDNLIGYANTLADGKPASGVEFTIAATGEKGTTGANGMATIPLPTKAGKGNDLLIARRGSDVAFVSGENDYYNDYSSSWTKQQISHDLIWYVTDDRQMYRPGEEVHLKGWLRQISTAKDADVTGLAGLVDDVKFTVNDAQGNQINTGSAKVNAIGGFDASFKLPATPNLGYTQIQFVAEGRMGGSFYHAIQVQEFRRPEFEVSTSASQGPAMVGGSSDITVSGKYYAGGGLPGAPVTWQVSASETSFTPPNRDDFVFGDYHPWWGWRSWWEEDGEGGGRSWHPPVSKGFAGKTDALGSHVLHLDFLSAKPARPMSVSANATVMDVNRQAWSSSTTLLVHPASDYIGLKSAKPFVTKGTPIELSVIGVDLDGKAAIGRPMEVSSARLDWTYEHGKYVKKELDAQTCTLTSAADAGKCSFNTPDGGSYEIKASITDDKGRRNETVMTIYVSGGKVLPRRDLAQEQVNLIPDKKEYAPSDTAELLVQAPFAPAEGIVTWRRNGIIKSERISMTGTTATIKVPLSEVYVPNLDVQVDLYGQAERTNDDGQADPSLPKRPAYAVGQINLPIPPRSRTLKVDVAPKQAKVSPGEDTSIDVAVHDASGKPVADAEVAVIVVDEAILALTGYQFSNPIDTFYSAKGTGTRDYYMQSYVKLAKPDISMMAQDHSRKGYGAGAGGMIREESEVMGRAMAEAPMDDKDAAMAPPAPPSAAAPMPTAKAVSRAKKTADRDGDGIADKHDADQATTAIAIRSNFNPLAAFAPSVRTGANGKATVSVKVPDNLTRYRIVAIAVAGDEQFGKGESALTARLPLMVRPAPPRFLNFGDTFSLPVTVQNQTDSPMKVRIGVRATNATITDGHGREVTVPANDRVEVLFPAAAEMAGTARFQFAASSGASADAAELAIPVWTPATTEAFATYGVVDDGAVRQPVALPGQVVKQFGGLEIETSSTQLQALTDAFLYLVHYPFECAEQRSSRIISIAALRDVLTAFHVSMMPTPKELEVSVDDDIDHLKSMQNYDGGFPFWERGHETWPFLSVHVTNALVRAKAKGFKVPAEMLSNALSYLRNIENSYPSYYDTDTRHTISSYALYVRKLAGDVDVKKATTLMRSAGGAAKLSMEANGWLLGTLAGNAAASTERAEIMKYLGNKVSETAGAANFVDGTSDGAYLILHSDRRVDGVILESMIQEAPKSDLLPKIVTGLLAHRKAGRWENTDENAFVLLALDLYFNTFEKVTPDFVARAWLGDALAGEHTFKGRQTDRFAIDVPMAYLADKMGGKGDLVLQKDGKGRMYYRVGMTYAPTDLKLAAADYGFTVQRRYESVDDKADVSQAADGTWKIKAGARVRVRLTMVAENRRYHVALVDPLPAGLEPMNPALAVTGDVPQDPAQQKERGNYWWWSSTWYEHQNMRDERVEAFTSLLWDGVHEYTYVARATTPGSFVVPPTKAEEMYMPETFGRSASDRVEIQ